MVQLTHQRAEILNLRATFGSVTDDQSLTAELLARLFALENVVLGCGTNPWQTGDAGEVLREVDSLLEHNNVTGKV